MNAAASIVHADVTDMTPPEPRALARREYDGLTMAISPAEARRRLDELRAFVQSVMVKDSDYGTIPGTNKPTLYQQGAQKLAEVYGFSHRFEIRSELDWDRGFFYFEVRCVLTSRRDGSPVGEGFGSANSHESKYRWRWVNEEQIPGGLDKAKLEKRQKWVFKNELPPGADYRKLASQERTSKKTGKPYTVYGLGETYRVPNPDVADVVNTLQKMACKRAYVHAVIGATRSSDLFTQDVEDLPPEVFGEPKDTRSWEKEEPETAPSNEVEKGESIAKEASPATAPAPRTKRPPKVTEDHVRYLEGAKAMIAQARDLASLSRAIASISEGVKAGRLHESHKDDLRAFAQEHQAKLKASPEPSQAAAAPPSDDGEPPADYQGATDNPDEGP
jgi:hypothetical protein